MTQQELKDMLKPAIEYLDSVPYGERIPSQWEVPKGYTLEKFTVGTVQVEHLVPEKKNGRVILHLHGGGYVVAYFDVYRDIAVQYSEMAGGAEIFSVDYSVAPTKHAPAALEDAVAVYQWLLSNGYESKQILFAGDSAGGNLVLITTLYLKEQNMPLPKGVIAISPWACVENTLESRVLNKENDLVIGLYGSQAMYHEVINSGYYRDQDKKNPLVSPIYGDYKGFPSLLIQVGDYEIFRDEAVLTGKAAKEAGVDVTQTTYPEMSHDFQLFIPTIEESRQAWKEMQAFTERIFA